ncbi:5-oxoprolinase (ATP-hydrolyzing) [Sodalis praecaptivus]|uniref:5-oxoprolinase (ATP-hydrolyzing) n=1 Tax=Sodalis praecaptivus TaxID=1239307 RepID=W0HRZ0_9GAMM|nr:hydantoinase/oxoprolinase family protein [Sodalis praecaptivus]AHF76591.1 5-oxoprolinase (ATP-hydrolyzing) [Sodalis praecaptivus]
MTQPVYRLGVDIGGTFTDVVLIADDGTIFSKKVLSTPQDYSQGIENGVAALLQSLNIPGSAISEFVHATTVATNTIIERKGARVGLVTTRGFRDVLEIGRFRTPRLYDIDYKKPDPLVPRQLRCEVTERIDAHGEVVTPLDYACLDAAVATFRQAGVEAVAVTLVNSYVNPDHERAAAAYIAERLPAITVTASVDLLPQLGEYERTSTTVVNAYIRPVVGRYVDALKMRLARLGIEAPLMIMQSSGGISPGEVVARQPIDIIESGPAAGVLGSARLGRHIGEGEMIVFDMGGTTAKATIIEDFAYALCPETEVGGGAALGTRMIKGAGYPVQVPTIDIAEVGAGGGSIAASDSAGGLQVGPRSAGAEPGPVAYGRGGTQATVTDANLLLGYLNPAALVSGELALDSDGARQVMTALGERIGLSVTETAAGIHNIADATMLRALRGVSSEKGRDPSQYTMLAIGGNGPVHACSLAEASGMQRIIIPPVAGLFSALGMLFADVEHQLVTAFYHRLDAVDAAKLAAAFDPLLTRGLGMLHNEGYRQPAQQTLTRFADLRYLGQTSPLTVEIPPGEVDLAALAATFHREHQHVFGYASPHEALQLVSLKLVCRGVPNRQRMPEHVQRHGEKGVATTRRQAYFDAAGWLDTPVISRAALSATPMAGPLIVEEYDTTIVVRPGWQAVRDDWNNVLLTTGQA